MSCQVQRADGIARQITCSNVIITVLLPKEGGEHHHESQVMNKCVFATNSSSAAGYGCFNREKGGMLYLDAHCGCQIICRQVKILVPSKHNRSRTHSSILLAVSPTSFSYASPAPEKSVVCATT